MAKNDRKDTQSLSVSDVGKMPTDMVETPPDDGGFSLSQFKGLEDGQDLIETLTQSHLDWAKEQGLIGEKLFVLKAGQVARGKFAGEGPPVVLARTQIDKVTKEVVHQVTIKTWRLAHENGNFIRVLSSYQLDQEMPAIPIGSPVQIIHGGQVETGNGQRVNNLLIQWPRKNALLETIKAEDDRKRGVLEAKTA